MVQESVKSYLWSPSNNNFDEEKEKNKLLLYVERMEPYGTSTILSSRSFFQDDMETVTSKVLDFQLKGDFLFAVKEANEVIVVQLCYFYLVFRLLRPFRLIQFIQ